MASIASSSIASVAGLKARVVAPRRAMNVIARAADEPAPSATTTEEAPPAPKAFSAKDMYGVSAPFGFFDPADMLQGKDENTIRRYREAEITHGKGRFGAGVVTRFLFVFHVLFKSPPPSIGG